MNEGIPTITFNSLPFWAGIQKTPGVRRAFPFALTAAADGPIRQITSDQIIADVVNAYLSDEYAFITPPPGASEWANSLGESYVAVAKSAIGGGFPKNILEIGGGSTWIASRLRDHYKPESYVLVDPSVRDFAEGVEVVHDYFPSPKLLDRCFDLVIGFNVLEHVPDPLSFLCSIRQQLTPDGKVILVYPDCERQLQQGDLNVYAHEHLSYFTEASSRWLASAAGYKVLELNRENDTCTVVLEVGANRAEASQQLNESQLILASAAAIQNLLTNTVEKIKFFLNNNQHVAFHGATAGLNTFLYIAELGGHQNIHIYDGDASKTGLYLPACSSAIMSPMDESYARNSLLVVSAMSFFEQIKQFAVEKAGLDDLQIIPLTGVQ